LVLVRFFFQGTDEELFESFPTEGEFAKERMLG
jgi:hypothetical protein